MDDVVYIDAILNADAPSYYTVRGRKLMLLEQSAITYRSGELRGAWLRRS